MSDDRSPQDQIADRLDRYAEKRAEQTGEPFEKAYAAVCETAEGRDLLEADRRTALAHRGEAIPAPTPEPEQITKVTPDQHSAWKAMQAGAEALRKGRESTMTFADALAAYVKTQEGSADYRDYING